MMTFFTLKVDNIHRHLSEAPKGRWKIELQRGWGGVGSHSSSQLLLSFSSRRQSRYQLYGPWLHVPEGAQGEAFGLDEENDDGA